MLPLRRGWRGLPWGAGAVVRAAGALPGGKERGKAARGGARGGRILFHSFECKRAAGRSLGTGLGAASRYGRSATAQREGRLGPRPGSGYLRHRRRSAGGAPSEELWPRPGSEAVPSAPAKRRLSRVSVHELVIFCLWFLPHRQIACRGKCRVLALPTPSCAPHHSFNLFFMSSNCCKGICSNEWLVSDVSPAEFCLSSVAKSATVLL